MAPTVIAVVNPKGGVGKTTTALNLADVLRDTHAHVAVVDADPRSALPIYVDEATFFELDPPQIQPARDDLTHDIQALSAHDILVIDTPPRDLDRLYDALRVCHLAIVPTRPSQIDLDMLPHALHAVRRTRTRAVIYLTHVDTRSRIQRDAITTLKQGDTPVLDACARVYSAYDAAFRERVGVVRHDPRSKAADDVRALCREIISLL